MTETITITLHGAPVAKGRPRFTRAGHAYTDAKTTAAERALVDAWRAQAGEREPHDGPVAVHIEACFPPARSWPKWKYHAAANGWWAHQGKPDVDNIAKTILDGLNGHAWYDDAQVDSLGVDKRYGADPRTWVTITFYPKPEKGSL